ncbi:SsrA-binding protein SmpB [Parasphaerochaeta coccoides]|uniref:SsrA-binding protein n=1 Tax=Parasphaerochaeta coccoides (strain ATCC BAA-1237 / DSM 17374 / SPN1) TaxID=760011 RepID=F4GK34_PARC1|nr:SsrA-binding protein SmpB [Parasphaerochaeta coccoides]AEC01806.1 SsrA-binding protein [Parasphaerochaeta coccoides DSM 17374]
MAKFGKDDVKVLQTNRKAYFNYEMVEDLECGIALTGTEVKSVRESRFSFSDSYVKIDPDGLKLISFTIQPYTHGNIHNHKSDRIRRLLAKKQEIKKWRRKVDEKGFTLVPTKVYLRGNLIKMQVSLARGKQLHDKRASLKERDMDRDARREMKLSNY